MPDPYELAAIHGDLTTAILSIRDRIQVIADGERDTSIQVGASNTATSRPERRS
jgi:hypothetical protein